MQWLKSCLSKNGYAVTLASSIDLSYISGLFRERWVRVEGKNRGTGKARLNQQERRVASVTSAFLLQRISNEFRPRV